MISLLLAIIYLSFISLGLPDAVLGSVWPTMHMDFNVDLSYAGIISMLIACGTIFSSLQSDRLTRRLGVGLVTIVSVSLTALGLLGFSFSNSFLELCLWTIPYGLGAGGVDAALNNYVALNFESKHMSWLHCMWGVGASLGPSIMGYALMNGSTWHTGYTYLFALQAVLTLILIFAFPLWKKVSRPAHDEMAAAATTKALTLKEIISLPGAKQVLITFFCYCAIEQTAALWAASYFVFNLNLSVEQAASWASLFFLGITLGRAASGFITLKFTNTQMIRGGIGIILLGIAMLFIPANPTTALFAFILIGLGCAPIYPCIIHSTPDNFGASNAQALTGVQMACAYLGTLSMPTFFGFLSRFTGVSFLPVFLLILLGLMYFMFESLQRKKAK